MTPRTETSLIDIIIASPTGVLCTQFGLQLRNGLEGQASLYICISRRIRFFMNEALTARLDRLSVHINYTLQRQTHHECN